MQEADIAVVGAGAIGLCIALGLRSEGRDVVLVDRDTPGSGTSRGNAGVIANYECVPLGTPSVLKSLPRLLFDSSSPLSIAPSALPRLSPWLMRFAANCLEHNARKNSAALAALLKNSLPAYLPVLEHVDAMSLLRREGTLHIFRTAQELEGASWERQLRHELGISQSIVDRSELRRLEPELPEEYEHGVFFPDAAHVTDPFELMQRLSRAFQEMGGKVLRAHVTELRHSEGRVTIAGVGNLITANSAVVACGAWSARLARQIGDRFPLETERGYHVEFPMAAPLLNRPVCPVSLGFYFTPMKGRLRAAGTVELSSLGRPANPRRLRLIESSTRRLFPKLGPTGSQWLGFRPSLPDSLPVIGRSTRARSVIYAFGHGHLGLTLAAETARIVTDLIVNNRDTTELAAISPARFQ